MRASVRSPGIRSKKRTAPVSAMSWSLAASSMHRTSLRFWTLGRTERCHSATLRSLTENQNSALCISLDSASEACCLSVQRFVTHLHQPARLPVVQSQRGHGERAQSCLLRPPSADDAGLKTGVPVLRAVSPLETLSSCATAAARDGGPEERMSRTAAGTDRTVDMC